MHLSPLVPEARGPGRPRVRAHFWADRDLADGFRAWFGREAAGAPTHGHTELMRWWQAFKPRLAREARRLDCDLGRRRDAVSVEVARLRADLQRARTAVEAGRDGLAELAGLYALQRRLDAAVRRYAPAPPSCARLGERVAGGMAAAFRKPATARRVAALRDARGILVTDGMGMADIMADAVAAVSRPPPPSPADREAVLGAVRTHSPRVPQAVADAAGVPVVTPAEVRTAATHSKPGTAPGPDGIPVDVWRKLGEPAFVLLAAVFTAVGATGETPPGFLDGVVASIYKAKDAADAANYRPLTMLGSDYRILAKVLATRWTPLLAAVVGPEQTAFLAGRRISDNICLTQMLPGLLAANAAEGVGPTGAALALLDFRKAYDTIDRGCLLAVMEAVGVGDGVLAWTRTILTHTYASAEVNGFISEPRQYAAGVRQGCPAAPDLFLFLGHRVLPAHLPGAGAAEVAAGHSRNSSPRPRLSRHGSRSWWRRCTASAHRQRLADVFGNDDGKLREQFFEVARHQAQLEFEADGTNAQALVRWGGALLELAHFKQGTSSTGMIQEAIVKLNAALEMDPDRADAQWCLGNAYTALGFLCADKPDALGQFAKAEECFRICISKDPSNDSYKKAIEMSQKAPEYWDEIQSHINAQNMAAGGGGGPGGKAPPSPNEFWWDVGGWLLLAGVITTALFVARVTSPAAKSD
ncbi:hypothetical protein FOA52_008620 [Chlamydomonas sp. UWO 241]|nr:hypothetical protein FOA52_008620 [Chlamydomonas sp. UWO 241]